MHADSVLREVRDPSHVFEIALIWAEKGMCKGRKGKLEIHRPPLFCSKEDSKIKCAFATLESLGPAVHTPFLKPQHHSVMEKVQVHFQQQNIPKSCEPWEE